MTKDSVRLTSALSVLVDAKRHINKWGSTAEDSGTELRTTRHFLQRAVNSFMCEVHDTQAAALLLGIPSYYSSERFVYTSGWQVVREALEVLGVEPPWVTPDPEDDADDLRGGADVEEGETVQIGMDSAWTREQKEESLEGMGGPGNHKVYCDHEGIAHAVSDAKNYRLRGFELDRFNLNEYKGCVTMVEMTPDEKEAAQAAHMSGEALTFEATKRRGRLPNASVSVSPQSALPAQLRCRRAKCPLVFARSLRSIQTIPCTCRTSRSSTRSLRARCTLGSLCRPSHHSSPRRSVSRRHMEAAPQQVCRFLRR